MRRTITAIAMSLSIVIAASTFYCTDIAMCAVFMEDDFESGDLSCPDCTTGQWGGSGKGSENITISSSVVRSGSYAMQLPYGASTWNTQQDFSLSTAQTDVYIRYYIYLPSNFVVPTDSPCNNKLIRLWGCDTPGTCVADDYNNFKMGGSIDCNDSNPGRLFPEARVIAGPSMDCTGGMGQAGNIGDLTVLGIETGALGSWHCWEWHFKVDSGSGDGALEFWIDGVLQFGDTTLSVANAPCAPNYFSAGYLMGWANEAYTEDTIIYIDDVIVADTYIGPDASDTTAPVISNTAPTTQQTCSSNPQSVTLSCDTDEDATCRYGSDGAIWSAMSEMATTGGTSHSQAVSLACGSAYQYDVLCQDTSENESDAASIDFAVEAEVVDNEDGVWHVRESDTHNTVRNGATYATAWRPDEIVWGSVEAGNRLCVHGEHSALTIGASGLSADQRVIVDFACDEEYGIINGQGTVAYPLIISGVSYVTINGANDENEITISDADQSNIYSNAQNTDIVLNNVYAYGAERRNIQLSAGGTGLAIIDSKFNNCAEGNIISQFENISILNTEFSDINGGTGNNDNLSLAYADGIINIVNTSFINNNCEDGSALLDINNSPNGFNANLTGNYFAGASEAGVLYKGASSGENQTATLSGCLFDNNARHFVSNYSTNNVVEITNCTFANAGSYNIEIGPDSSGTNNFSFRNCIFNSPDKQLIYGTTTYVTSLSLSNNVYNISDTNTSNLDATQEDFTGWLALGYDTSTLGPNYTPQLDGNYQPLVSIPGEWCAIGNYYDGSAIKKGNVTIGALPYRPHKSTKWSVQQLQVD